MIVISRFFPWLGSQSHIGRFLATNVGILAVGFGFTTFPSEVLSVIGAALPRSLGEALQGERIKDFTNDLGVAFLTAFVLNLSIEAFNRARHRRHLHELDVHYKRMQSAIGQNVINAVFEKQIPERVFEEVQEGLIKASIYRKNAKLVVTFERLDRIVMDAPSGLVLITEEHTHDVENTSSEPYAPKATASIQLIENLRPFADIVNICIGAKTLSREDIRRHSKDDGKHLAFEYEDRDNPLSAGHSIPISITLQYPRYVRDECVVVSTKPQSCCELEVIDSHRDFSIHAESLHPKGLTKVRVGAKPGVQKWKLEHGMFPGQGIWFGWTPAKPTPVTVAADQVDRLTKAIQDRRDALREQLENEQCRQQ